MIFKIMANILENSYDDLKQESLEQVDCGFTSVLEQLAAKTNETDILDRKLSSSSFGSSDSSIRSEDDNVPVRTGNGPTQTSSALVQRNLELHLSRDAQQKIHDILDAVRNLSEKEKLLLYLKLPTKQGSYPDGEPIPLSNTRQEQTQAFQWIRKHLEECDSNCTLPKHEVYDDYRAYCDSLGANRHLSAPDFGKIIKCVFPKVKARRLGTRGNSKYCYSGLRKKVAKECPSLPNLKGGDQNAEVNNNNDADGQCSELSEDQTLSAACVLVCEWANKLLGRVFGTLIELARFLVGGSYVSTKSMAAFVVMSATENKIQKMSNKLVFRPLEQNIREASLINQQPFATQLSNEEKKVSSSVSNPTVTPKTPTIQSSPRTPTPRGTQVVPRTPTIPQSIARTPTFPQQVVKTERPQSLPGLVIASNQDNLKLGSQLMSPPACPPPRTSSAPQNCPSRTPSTPQNCPRVSPHEVSTVVKTVSKGIPSAVQQLAVQQLQRGNFSLKQQLQQTGNVALQQQQQSPGYVSAVPRLANGLAIRHQPIVTTPGSTSPQVQNGTTSNHRQTHVSRTPASYRRSESCPYPSISPKTTPKQNIQTVPGSGNQYVMSPNDGEIPRHMNWPPPQPLPSLPNLQPDSADLSSSPDIESLLETTPNRPPPLQRCHSVPVSYSTPQKDAFQPLTPQLGIVIPMTSMLQQLQQQHQQQNSPSYGQLKELRDKVLHSEASVNKARRNLTPFLDGSPGINLSPFLDNSQTSVGSPQQNSAIVSTTVRGESFVTNSSPARREQAISNLTPFLDNNQTSAGSPQQNGAIVTTSVRRENFVTNGSPVRREQTISNLTHGSSGINNVDNLLESFSLGDFPGSGSEELSDLDGLDDVETVELLKRLNSGDNIWCNEWTNSGMPIIETS